MLYPESNGEPMGETQYHQNTILNLLFQLQDAFRDHPEVVVGGDLMLYYAEGDPKKCVCPDVFVVLGAPKDPPRRTWKIWEEGGHAPDIVFEVTSAKTRRRDEGIKRQVYAELGVRELVLFDPLREYLNPPFQAYQLRGRRYVPMAITEERVWSEVLGVSLQREGELLRILLRNGEKPPLLGEIGVERRRWRQAALSQQHQAHTWRQTALAWRQTAELQKQELHVREAEIEALRRQLEDQRSG